MRPKEDLKSSEFLKRPVRILTTVRKLSRYDPTVNRVNWWWFRHQPLLPIRPFLPTIQWGTDGECDLFLYTNKHLIIIHEFGKLTSHLTESTGILSLLCLVPPVENHSFVTPVVTVNFLRPLLPPALDKVAGVKPDLMQPSWFDGSGMVAQ